MGLKELREQLLGEIKLLVDSKLMEVSIGTFVRKFLVLLMRECKLQWSDIKDLNQKLTEELRNFKEQQGPANDQNIIEIVSRAVCTLFDFGPTTPSITLEKGVVNVVLFIGVTKESPNEESRGYGKTTAIARYALQMKKENNCFAYVVCADIRRPKAFEKLRQISGGRFPCYKPEEGLNTAMRGLKKAVDTIIKLKKATSVVILDVNARHLTEISEEMSCSFDIIVVLDSTIKSEEIYKQIEICCKAKLCAGMSFIITKADHDLGALMNVAKGKFPVAMIGMGEDIEAYAPNVKSFARHMLDLSFGQSGSHAQIPHLLPLDGSAQESLSCSKEAGEEINRELAKIDLAKPAAPEQILDTELIDADNAPEDEAAHQEKNMNTDEKEANDKPKESGSEEQKNEPSKMKKVCGAEKGIIRASIPYVMEDDFSSRAKYSDGRVDDKLLIIKLFAGDLNTLEFYRSARHKNLLAYRFDHVDDDGRYNVGFVRCDQSLEEYLRDNVGPKLIHEYTLLSVQAPVDQKRTTKYLPPRVREILKDIVSFMVYLLERNQEVRSLGLANIGIKNDDVQFYDLDLCRRTGEVYDDLGKLNASKIGPLFSQLIVDLFKRFNIQVHTQGTNDLKSLVLQLEKFKGTAFYSDFLCNLMAVMSPKDMISFIANLRDKRHCFPSSLLASKYQDGITYMKIRDKDWPLQFKARAVELKPVYEIFFHDRPNGYSNSPESLVLLCRCLCHHLYEKFKEDGLIGFNTLDVDLTVMALFDRELIDLHETFCHILKVFLT